MAKSKSRPGRNEVAWPALAGAVSGTVVLFILSVPIVPGLVALVGGAFAGFLIKRRTRSRWRHRILKSMLLGGLGFAVVLIPLRLFAFFPGG